MDPWLESRWESVHTSFIVVAQEKLNEQLPNDLIARVNERLFVGYIDGDSRSIVPDVFVTETGVTGEARSGSTAVVDEPVLIRFASEPVTEVHLEIFAAGDDARIITAIELLSFTNKANTQGRKDYLQKRNEYHAAGASVVEIDLLRQGPHLVDVPPGYLRGDYQTPYKVCVRRGWKLDAHEAEYYPIPLRSRLPRIRVPLRKSEVDVVLDLQAVLETAYIRGRYYATNYDRPLEPPLGVEDAEWSRKLIEKWRQDAIA